MFRMEGKGEYTFPTQSRYEGEMEDGMFHGKGVMYFPNGGKYEGTWEKGICKQVPRFPFLLSCSFSEIPHVCEHMLLMTAATFSYFKLNPLLTTDVQMHTYTQLM